MTELTTNKNRAAGVDSDGPTANHPKEINVNTEKSIPEQFASLPAALAAARRVEVFDPQPVACPSGFTWCTVHRTTDHPDDFAYHNGRIGAATASASEVTVTAEVSTEGAVGFYLDFGDRWSVAADQIDNEAQDIANIASDARTIMRTWRLANFPEVVIVSEGS